MLWRNILIKQKPVTFYHKEHPEYISDES